MKLRNPWNKPEIQVVEVEKSQRVLPLDADIARVVASLQSHPGFLYLLGKLKFHREILRSTLDSRRQVSMEDVIMLQSGIAWSGWLKDELEKAVDFKTSAPQAPGATEQSIFEESQRQLEVLR